MKQIAFFFFLLLVGVATAPGQSPYAGERDRSVKSLSPEDIASLSAGKGMGFAKLAELNHYPGPKHVLELADVLQLSPAQVSATEELFRVMQSNAISLGEKLVAAETSLDHDFRQGTIDADSLRQALDDIGKIRSQLRYVHLEAHLRQKNLLTPDQVAMYDEARGYGRATHSHSDTATHHE